ncbi:MAG TPA: FHA domain-containing protein [Candidatus Acidoferrum sp.]|nr:FHA domain-containing protein [Candidatus Acidoferrum sp.]
MIVCNRCGKENQDHYKFCLGCGAELATGPAGDDAGNVGTMKTMMADSGQRISPTPPGGVPHTRLPGVGAAPAGLPGMSPMSGGSPRAPSPQYGNPGSGGVRAPAGPPPGVGAPGQFGGMPAAGGVGGQIGGAGAGYGGRAPSPVWGAPPAAAPVGHNAGHGGIGMAAGPPAAMAAAGPRKCPHCGSDVPVNFKFCGVCGQSLGAAPAAAPAYPVAPPGFAATAAPQAMPRASLTLIRPDGSEGGTFPLREGDNRLGRDHGAIFENDGYLSPTHCELLVMGNGAVVRDLDSLNGVFVRMTGEEEIQPGQVIRMGQELLRFDLIEPPTPLEDGTEVMGSPNPGYWGKITVIIGNGLDGSAYPLLGDSVTMGRERGDINFPDDGYVSGLHARLSARGGKVYLADLGSSNGTFLRVQGERKLGNESFVLLGQQLFKLALR